MADELERFYTHPALARAIVARLEKYGDLETVNRVLDPSVGKGAFADAVRLKLPDATIRTIDIDRTVKADIHGDYLLTPATGGWDLIATNPPFSLAQRFVERSVGTVKKDGTVAFLLLMGFLGSKERKGFFERYPVTSVDFIRPRPPFESEGKSSGSDMRDYGLFRWCPQDFGCSGGTRLGYLDWDPKEDPRQIEMFQKETK